MIFNGYEFTVEYRQDNAYHPWEVSDGHGPVRKLARREHKRPGERLLGAIHAYDWQEAVKIAQRGSWGLAPADQPANWSTLTPAQRAELAVEADFRYLRAWCLGDWSYVIVTVTATDYPTYSDSLGGVETYKDYHEEVAKDLAEYLSAELMKEAFERQYWAERDVLTTKACSCGR